MHRLPSCSSLGMAFEIQPEFFWLSITHHRNRKAGRSFAGHNLLKRCEQSTLGLRNYTVGIGDGVSSSIRWKKSKGRNRTAFSPVSRCFQVSLAQASSLQPSSLPWVSPAFGARTAVEPFLRKHQPELCNLLLSLIQGIH